MKLMIEFDMGDITAGSVSIVEKELTYNDIREYAFVTSESIY